MAVWLQADFVAPGGSPSPTACDNQQQQHVGVVTCRSGDNSGLQAWWRLDMLCVCMLFSEEALRPAVHQQLFCCFTCIAKVHLHVDSLHAALPFVACGWLGWVLLMLWHYVAA